MAELARAYMIHEEPQAALDWAERTLVAAERLDLVAEIAEAMITRALVLQILGRFREATTSLRGVLWLAEDHGLAMAELRAYNNLSFLLASDDPRAGLAVATEGIERARRFGSRQWSALLASNAAASAFRAGEFSAAESMIAEWTEAATAGIAGVELHCVAAAIAGARGEPAEAGIDALRPFMATSTDPQLMAVIQTARAWVALAEGRLGDAFEQAMDGARHATGYAVTGYPLAVRAAAWAGDRGRAQAAADAFAAIGVHGRGIEAARRTIEGAAAALDGRTREAAAAFGDASRRWRDLRVDFELAMCDLDIVTLLGPDEPDGRAAATEARAIFEHLDARAFLARLDAAPARLRPPLEARSGSGVPAG